MFRPAHIQSTKTLTFSLSTPWFQTLVFREAIDICLARFDCNTPYRKVADWELSSTSEGPPTPETRGEPDYPSWPSTCAPSSLAVSPPPCPPNPVGGLPPNPPQMQRGSTEPGTSSYARQGRRAVDVATLSSPPEKDLELGQDGCMPGPTAGGGDVRRGTSNELTWGASAARKSRSFSPVNRRVTVHRTANVEQEEDKERDRERSRSASPSRMVGVSV